MNEGGTQFDPEELLEQARKLRAQARHVRAQAVYAGSGGYSQELDRARRIEEEAARTERAAQALSQDGAP